MVCSIFLIIRKIFTKTQYFFKNWFVFFICQLNLIYLMIFTTKFFLPRPENKGYQVPKHHHSLTNEHKTNIALSRHEKRIWAPIKIILTNGHKMKNELKEKKKIVFQKIKFILYYFFFMIHVRHYQGLKWLSFFFFILERKYQNLKFFHHFFLLFL